MSDISILVLCLFVGVSCYIAGVLTSIRDYESGKDDGKREAFRDFTKRVCDGCAFRYVCESFCYGHCHTPVTKTDVADDSSK